MKQAWTIIAFLALLLARCVQHLPVDTKTPRMTVEELKDLLDHPEVILVDVRLADEWKRTGLKIKVAVREDPEKDYKTWASKYPKDKTLVFYCS